MKTIKLLLCVLLTAMSLNVFADEVGRYQMINANEVEVFVLDTKTGAVKHCYLDARDGMFCGSNVLDTRGIEIDTSGIPREPRK